MSKPCAANSLPAISARRKCISCGSRTSRAAPRARSSATRWRRSWLDPPWAQSPTLAMEAKAQKSKQQTGDNSMPEAGSLRRVNRLPAERRVLDIMTAARAVFTEKSYNDALISDIAERAGVVDGSIYRFFTNKRDLLVRVVEHWYEGMLADDDEQFASVRGTWNRIRFIVHHHLGTIRREPALCRLVFQELRPDPLYRQTRLFKLNQA